MVEHAIVHSFKLNNPLNILYSCLNGGRMSRIYDSYYNLGVSERKGQIHWTEGMHYSERLLLK